MIASDGQRRASRARPSGSRPGVAGYVCMRETLRGADRDRLERSCSARADSIRFGTGAPGLERAEVRLATCAFSPHRHDTYAIGITTVGRAGVPLPGPAPRLPARPAPRPVSGRDARRRAGDRRRLRLPHPLRRARARPRALGGGPLPFVADPVQAASPATRELERCSADRRTGRRPRQARGRPRRSPTRSAPRPASRTPRAADRPRGRRPRPRPPRGARERADAGGDARADRRDRPLRDRAPVPARVRHEPDRYRTCAGSTLARTAIQSGVPLARAAATRASPTRAT